MNRLGEGMLPVGCVGLKGAGGGMAEVKRLWVAPSARGLGLAKRLMAATIRIRIIFLRRPFDVMVR